MQGHLGRVEQDGYPPLTVEVVKAAISQGTFQRLGQGLFVIGADQAEAWVTLEIREPAPAIASVQ